MAEVGMIHRWNGKPIEELPRDDLIEALKWVSDQYAELMSAENIRKRALGSAEMIKREAF